MNKKGKIKNDDRAKKQGVRNNASIPYSLFPNALS